MQLDTFAWLSYALLRAVDTSRVSTGKVTTRGEQVLWQQQYLKCCSELGRWDTVHEHNQAVFC